MCATAAGVLPALEVLTHAVDRWPWIAPVVVLPDTEGASSPSSSLAEVLRDRLAVVIVGPGRGSPVTARQIVQAVALRPPPTPAALARWTSSRLKDNSLLEPLEELFSYAVRARASLPRSPASYSRALGSASALTARDWQALARLAGALHSAARKNFAPRQTGASTSSGPRRNVRRYAERYLDMTWAAAATLAGWEWVLECALSREALTQAP